MEVTFSYLDGEASTASVTITDIQNNEHPRPGGIAMLTAHGDNDVLRIVALQLRRQTGMNASDYKFDLITPTALFRGCFFTQVAYSDLAVVTGSPLTVECTMSFDCASDELCADKPA